ncbi:MAG TPA: hypothetical protein VKZ63_05495 [Kofleriaceae bacterium]|nr:hypothetical protein [Kofleriaceae bacterium]
MPDPATVFLATALGVGSSAEAPPGLIEPTPAIAGHLELGLDLRRVATIAIATSLARSWYDNTVPPPESVTAGDHVVLTRAALGVTAEGRWPLGPVAPVVGGGVYVLKASASASGALLGIRGEYYRESDTGLGLEARAGADLDLSDGVVLGLRGGYTWARAELPGLTDGAATVGGLSIEARIAVDLTGLRFDPQRR